MAARTNERQERTISGDSAAAPPTGLPVLSVDDLTMRSAPIELRTALRHRSGRGGLSDAMNVSGSRTGCTETVLHAFEGSPRDGDWPMGRLVADRAGLFYGVTADGEADHYGTVFTISPSGTQTTIYAFKHDRADGSGRKSGLIMDKAGDFYGTTETGGTHDDGTVFEVTPGGTETVLYSFRGGPDGETPVTALTLGRGGNLYGTTFTGGAHAQGTVFRLDPGGTETVLYSFKCGSRDGSVPHAGLLRDRAGNLYGTTEFGGRHNDGTVFKLSPSGAETNLHTFKGGRHDGTAPAAGLLADGAGDLYGTTAAGGAHNDGIVFKIDCGIPSDDRMASAGAHRALARGA
ncbi:MAG: choice-of-anchor tandem repeat GloVer-containing protein [Steroidobacteraceae bacterium]